MLLRVEGGVRGAGVGRLKNVEVTFGKECW